MISRKLAELGVRGGRYSALLGLYPLSGWCPTGVCVPAARQIQRLTQGSMYSHRFVALRV